LQDSRELQPWNQRPAKWGDIVSAKGENLDKSSITEVYLTDGSHDTKVQVTEQTETEIKFKVQGDIKAGRYHILMLTADMKSLVEQPVRLHRC
jgi:hypothetical protein